MSSLRWEAMLIENVTRARNAASMTQSELARRVAEYGLPFHQQTIQRIEAGERPIRLNEAMAMCEVLGLSLPTAIHHEMLPAVIHQNGEAYVRSALLIPWPDSQLGEG